MASAAQPIPKLDRYVIIHVATTCDEHGVYVTKDSAEVIELGWILLDNKTCDEVCNPKWRKRSRWRIPEEECRPLTIESAVPRKRARQAGQYPYHPSLQ